MFLQLVIHCGVHGSTNKICVEKYAYNSNYCKPDWSGKCLENETICLRNNGTNCEKLTTCIDVQAIVNELNSVMPDEKFVYSTEVGK